VSCAVMRLSWRSRTQTLVMSEQHMPMAQHLGPPYIRIFMVAHEEGHSPHVAFFIRWRVARSRLRCQRRLMRCACVLGICSNFSSMTVWSDDFSLRKYHMSLKKCRTFWRASSNIFTPS
jgi:hypothetical protein